MSLSDSIGGRIDLAYDVLNRLVRESTAAGSIIYTYDVLGRRASMAVNGITVAYTYDADSWLTQITQGNQTVTIGYDAKGRRTTLSYPNGTTTTYSYDAVSRLTGMFHAKGTTSFESISYGYDAGGNRTAVVRGSNPATFLPVSLQATYDAANEQVSVNSSTPNMTYDANGNLTSRTDSTGTTTYTWDARNRLIGVNGPNVTASFVYDAVNRRISKTINGVTTQYLYDRKNVVQEVTSGTVSATYLRSLRIDEPFARLLTNFTNGMEVYHRDALRTTLLLTDDTGAVKTTYTYTPFGDTTVIGTPSTNPFQYAGRENDGIGLYHYRMRYYSPALHRFIQEDPIGLMGGVNMYAYVRNNPMRYIDPFGLDKKENNDDDYPWFWWALCIIDPNCEPNVPPEFLPYIPTVGGQVGGGDVNPGDLQKVSRSEADKIAQQNGYRDAEQMKQDYGGKSGGQFNLSIDKSTGQVVLTPVNAGSGPNIPTGVFRK